MMERRVAAGSLLTLSRSLVREVVAFCTQKWSLARIFSALTAIFSDIRWLRFLGKSTVILIIVDRGDSPYAPTAVEHEVAGVEGDVLLEVRDRFLGVAPRLSQVGNAQVLVQVAVAGVLLGIRLGDLGARLRVLRLIAQNCA